MLTIEEVKKDIATYEARLKKPVGLTPQQIQIYRLALVEANQALAELQACAQGPITPAPAPPQPETYKRTAPPPTPPPVTLSEAQHQPPPIEGNAQPPITSQTITVRTAGAQPARSEIPAALEVHHDTDPHNPEITIRWADGYTLSVNEAAARSRFKSTFQDTHALKVVKERRFDKIWRWDSPWRCAGFYQALTYFYGGQAPTAYQCGLRYLSESATIIFQLITHTALAAESGKTTVK